MDDGDDQRNQKPILIIRLMSKRRNWAFLFVAVYSVLLFSSWNLLQTTLGYYRSLTTAISDSPYANSASRGLSALYASATLGLAFGLLSLAAALAVAVPAMLVTWITVLVLLAFCGRRKRDLVVVAKRLTGEIIGFLFKILIKEGNVVAAVCAVLGYFFLLNRNGDQTGFGFGARANANAN